MSALCIVSFTTGQALRSSCEPLFTDVTRSSAITFINRASSTKTHIVESVGGGVAFLDFDRDQQLDIYIVSSFAVDETRSRNSRPSAALYRNNGDGTFKDVAWEAGVADAGWAIGVSVADYDNDGFEDLYVTCYGQNKLFRNQGDGTFEDTTTKAGVGDPRFSTGATWGDYNRDGWLDLFVANYVRVDLKTSLNRDEPCLYRGLAVQCGPQGLTGAGDSLYRNDGNGAFTDVSHTAGVYDPKEYYGLGATWTDIDEDGWPDLFVANDTQPNYAYRNNHDGTFTEDAFNLGLAVDENGMAQSSMGLSVGDYDRDNRLDIIVTNFSDEYNTIYRKQSDHTFEDWTYATRTIGASLPHVGWGVKFFDYDNNGWLDLLVVNGHVYPQVEGAYQDGMYAQSKLLYRNQRNGTFSQVSICAETDLAKRRVSRGAAFGDFDEDGDLDVIVNETDGLPMLLRNDARSAGVHWVSLKLVGTESNRDAIGARVLLKSGGLFQVDEVRSGDSYLSHSDRRLHFGLGVAAGVDEVMISWPSGLCERYRNLQVDQTVRIKEGTGRALSRGF